MFKKLAATFAAVLISVSAAWPQASLLPNAKQTFLDSSGNPLASGTVDFYVPNTNTRKTTWTNSTESSMNTNPVMLDQAGRALIYGQGSYRQVVKDALGNTQWDAVTAAPSSGTSVFLTDAAPAGTILAYSGLTLPTNYLWAAGQAVSRVTYSELLAAITLQQTVTSTASSTTLAGFSDTSQFKVGAAIEGPCLSASTTIATIASDTSVTVSAVATSTGSCSVHVFPFGAGNGSTTFNVPDMRGRVPAGRDNINNTVANVLTNAYCTAANTISLGSTCGTQSKTLITANLPPYTPSGTATDSGHTHGLGNNLGYGYTASAGTLVFGNIGTNLVNTSSGTANVTFAGAAQGGVSTPLSAVQPTTVVNYIVKYRAVDPTSNGGVTSVGGMTGDIACGGIVTCSGQTITVLGGDGTPGGATGTVQYNSGSSIFGGITGATTDGVTLTMASPVFTGTPKQNGSGSGAISFATQAAAGTYNWNWPITPGTAGQVLSSGGGGSSPMTWTAPFNLIGSSLYPNITAPITTTANSTNGNADIVVASAAGLVAGMVTDGSTFQVGCTTAAAAFRSSYITNIVGTTITMSCPSTATQTGGAITFGHARYDPASSILANTGGFRTLLVGQASQGNTASWLPQIGTGQSFLDVTTLQVVQAPGALWGAVFAGRTSDANSNTTFPITCFYLADSGSAVGGECQYTQSNLYAATNNLSSHVQHEYSINSNWTAVEMDPYAIQPTNSTRNVRWDCGTGSFSPAPSDCSAVADILTNGAKYKAVFVVQDGALDTAASRIAPFAALPQSVSVTWYSAANTRLADIYGHLAGGFPELKIAMPTNGALSFSVNNVNIFGANAGVLFPNTNNAFALGDTPLRFSNVYSVLGNFSGGVTASGLPTSAGGGGLYVCVDTAGVLYKKSACP